MPENAGLAHDLGTGDRQHAEAALSNLCSELRAGDWKSLTEYLRSSPLCAELFGLWAGKEFGEGGRIVVLVIEVFAEVLEGHFEPDARTARTRSGIAGRIISERLIVLYKQFGSERDQLLRLCLRLLAGVNSVSSALSAQLLRTFNFAHEDFTRLAGRRTRRSGGAESESQADVRSFYIKFGLSFLRWKDSNLTNSAVCVKGFLSQVFPGLRYDKPQDALSFLNDIVELVLNHPHVSRHSKLFLFSAFALRHLCTLLASDNTELSQCVGRLLTNLCTDTFLFRTSQQQLLLLDMCLEMQPLDLPQQEVITSILSAHPILQFSYCSRLTLWLQPKLTWRWLLNMRFLTKLLRMDASSLVGEAARAARGREQGELELRMSWMLQVLVPQALQKKDLERALLDRSLVVALAALQLLTSLLQRVQRALGTGQWDARSRVEFLQRVGEGLPELKTVLKLWKKLAKDPDPDVAKKLLRQGLVDKAEVEDARVLELLELPEGGLAVHTAFAAWCTTVGKYAEVLPQSLLELHFDWNKLFAAVIAPLLPETGIESEAPPHEALARILPCIECLDMAMRSSGCMQTAQMSRQQLSWVRMLLEVHTSRSLKLAGEHAAAIRSACDAAVRRSLHHLAVFGMEEDTEISIWISQLGRRPTCVAFFSQVLQDVTSRPGDLVSVLHDSVDGPPSDREAGGGCTPRCTMSLFLLAALQRLAGRSPEMAPESTDGTAPGYSMERLPCARLVKGVMCTLATLLPAMAHQLLWALEKLGPWSPEPRVREDEEAGQAPCEGRAPESIRQASLSRLADLNKQWLPRRRPSSRANSRSSASKRRKTGAAESEHAACGQDCSMVIEKTVQIILEVEDVDGDMPCDEEPAPGASSFWVLRQKLAHCVDRGSLHGHSAAYVLLEGIRMCISVESTVRLACGYLLTLIDLVPAVAAATSPVLEHAASHAVWPDLVSLAVSSPAGSGPSTSLNLCVALALRFLCQLLESRDRPSRTKEDAAVLVGTCKTLLLPLWQHVSFTVDLTAEYTELTGGSEGVGPQGDGFTDDLANLAAQSIIRLCSGACLLDELVSITLEHGRQSTQLSLVAAMLNGSGGKSGDRPVFQELSSQRRVGLLKMLAGTAAGPEGAEAARALQRFLTLDRAGFMQFALTSAAEMPWFTRRGEDAAISVDLVPLIEQACWVNPELRKDVIRQLNWSTSEPRAVLLLAVSLAPYEGSLPFLDGRMLESVPPKALLPLPPWWQLCRLLALHPSPALLRLLQEAAASAGGSVCRQWFSLCVEAQRGRASPLERALLRFLAAHQKALGSGSIEGEGRSVENAGVFQVCRVLPAFKQGPSEALQARLQPYAEALARHNPEAAAVLLSCLLEKAGNAPPPDWQCRLAGELLEPRPAEELQEWQLAHAARWWRHCNLGTTRRQAVLADLRRKYTASMTRLDRWCRHVFLDDAAAFADESRSPSTASSDPWAFRRWCGVLPPWSDSGTWNWVFEPHRIKTTVDSFCYDRPMRDAVPWAHDLTLGTWTSATTERIVPGDSDRSSSSTRQGHYDIGYVVPFLAGQFRALWMEHGALGGLEFQRTLAPLMSAMASGGTLELLLLACACTDSMIRACAHEALSIFLAMAGLWTDAAHESTEGGKKQRLPFRELLEIVRLLHFARDALEAPKEEGEVPAALPRPVASVLSACIPVMLEPHHFLYLEIGTFLTSKPWAVLSDIPLFAKLLLSGLVQSHEARVWVFRALRRGLAGGVCGELQARADGHASSGAGVWDSRASDSVDDLSNAALARRRVVEWLLSFAGSHELGSFGVWQEAVSCLEGLLSGCGVGVLQRFSIPEWIAGQAVRRWVGITGKEHHSQALQMLLRLLEVTLRQSSSITVSELLSLTAAVRVVVQGCVTDAGTGDGRQGCALVCTVWFLVLRLAELSRANQKVAAEGSVDGEWHERRPTSAKAACAANFSCIFNLLQHLLDKMGSGRDGMADGNGVSILAECLATQVKWHRLFVQALALLEASPLSTVLHCLIHHLAEHFLEIPEDSVPGDHPLANCIDSFEADDEEWRRRELGPIAQEGVLLAVGSVLWAAQAHSLVDSELRMSLCKLLNTLTSLPFYPSTAWRLQVLVSCVFLALHPAATVDGALLARLPGPDEILLGRAQSEIEPGTEREGPCLAASAKLLGSVLSACDASAAAADSGP